jgi:hypothetical protein
MLLYGNTTFLIVSLILATCQIHLLVTIVFIL